MPSTSATAILLQTLREAVVGWREVRPWGVAYSGGRDSAVLLWALVQTAGADRLQALHVDHGWRPAEERKRESEAVRGWCSSLGVSLRQFPPPEQPRPTEDSARAYRYSCFQDFLSSHPDSPVFLAHHADDQAETILMRILRGRSWQGLGGMSPRRGPYLRPLLGLPGSLLARVAEEQSIPFHEDSTNQGDGPARNFLRHQVFPLLQRRFPRAKASLREFADAWRQLAPSGELDPAWTMVQGGAECPVSAWDEWSPLQRQAQLLSAAAQVRSPLHLTRRFLEGLSKNGRASEGRGSGWRWIRTEKTIRWELLPRDAIFEYYIKPLQGVAYDLGSYRMSWEANGAEPGLSAGLKIPGINPGVSWVWRSAVPGMPMTSTEGPWDRKTRHKRLGGQRSERWALVMQEGQVRAVVDPLAGRLRWFDSRQEKLNNNGIFVTLVVRSDYER